MPQRPLDCAGAFPIALDAAFPGAGQLAIVRGAAGDATATGTVAGMTEMRGMRGTRGTRGMRGMRVMKAMRAMRAMRAVTADDLCA